MSYKALYRKYRPKSFDDVLGQEQIVTTLKNIINSNKISHAYLFAGPRGTGKTSVAHVFAKEINKKASGNTTLNPLDVIEIDAASNNGVAEVRTIIDSSKYAPHEEKYKIYIIDEVHMLTKGAFNALLKTLEEPPAHVIFILATTEPDKMPITILSRLQRFNFRQIENKVIESQLKNVLKKEETTYDEDSIRLIATIAQGGMRDALSIADQASAYGNNNISFEIISKVFGLISNENQIKLFNYGFFGDAKKLLEMVNIIINNGADLERLTISFINILRDFIVFKKTKAESLLRYLNKNELDLIKISEKAAYEYTDVFTPLLSDLKTSMMPRQIFELAMLKLVSNNKIENSIEVLEKDEKVFNTNEIFVEQDISENQEDLNIEAKRDDLDVEVKNDDLNENNNVDISFDNHEEIIPDEIINTDEINLTAEMALEEEAQVQETNSISDELLDTQEVNLQSTTEEETEEIDLVSMFNTHTEEIKVIQEDSSPNVDEIINLLVQTDKASAMVAKEKIISAPSLSGNTKYGSYISLFDSLKVIAKGKNFVLLTSKSDDVVKQIRADKGRQSLIDFAKDLFGEPTWIFAITIEEFEEIKTKYKELALANNLPEPKIIEKPKVSEKVKSKEEEYGSDLFGSLFS